MPKGRPKAKEIKDPKKKVTLSADEFHLIAEKFRVLEQDLLDDLAMGIIPTIADLGAPLTALPEVLGSGKSVEAACSKAVELNRSKIQQNQKITPRKRLSWADEAEEEDKRVVVTIPTDKSTSSRDGEKDQRAKSFAEEVKGDGLDLEGDLDFIIPGNPVVFTKEEWDEGSNL